MRAGALRHRVQIQRATISRDAMGGEISTWATVATRWAEVAGLSGREYLAAQAGQATADHVITLRHLDGVTPAMRVLHGGRTFDVVSVLEDPRHTELRLMAREAVEA